MKSDNSSGSDENSNKTLYIRLPHTIRNTDEIRELIPGDIQIKLPRQASRHCHVIFSSVEEKMKQLKEVRKKKIDNKRIIACPPRKKPGHQEKNLNKKIKIPKPKPAPKITRILCVKNINLKTHKNALKKALNECKSVTFLSNPGKDVKQAIVRFENPEIATEYLKKERPWPILDGNQLEINPDTRKQKKKKSGLKIWDGEVEITDNSEKIDIKKNKKNDKPKIKRVEKTDNEKKEIINNKLTSTDSTIKNTEE